MQVLLNVLRGYTVQAALDAPRFCISVGAGDSSGPVYFEEGISEETLAELKGELLLLL